MLPASLEVWEDDLLGLRRAHVGACRTRCAIWNELLALRRRELAHALCVVATAVDAVAGAAAVRRDVARAPLAAAVRAVEERGARRRLVAAARRRRAAMIGAADLTFLAVRVGRTTWHARLRSVARARVQVADHRRARHGLAFVVGAARLPDEARPAPRRLAGRDADPARARVLRGATEWLRAAHRRTLDLRLLGRAAPEERLRAAAQLTLIGHAVRARRARLERGQQRAGRWTVVIATAGRARGTAREQQDRDEQGERVPHVPQPLQHARRV